MTNGGLVIEIVPLDASHSAATFSCGDEYIDRWCKKLALPKHQKYVTRSYVAVEQGSDKVIGIYSLSLRALEAHSVRNSGFSKEVPAVYLESLGVCESNKNQGVGSALLVDAFKRTLKVTDEVGLYCLWLDSISEDMAKFYEDRQFLRFKRNKLSMYALIDTLRDAVGP